MAELMVFDEVDTVREQVRRRYADAATSASGCGNMDAGSGSCCAPGLTTDRDGVEVFGASLYAGEDEPALAASLGCGVPTAVAELHLGEVVLDLGSGAGGDVLIAARRVGPTGRAIGLDMTDEMLGLARANAATAGLDNVAFHKGYIEQIPLADRSVDVVISNCVINLSADKPRVFAEAARVLRPGGRLAVSDVIADEHMDEATRADMQQWTGCIAGALTRRQFEQALADAGFVGVSITETHRVHEHAGAAIIRAAKPADCCEPAAQADCCAPEAKAGCCGAGADAGASPNKGAGADGSVDVKASGSCGCRA